MKEAKQALQIAIDYMNDRLEDHDCKYQRHLATEAERINILADIETVKEALAKQEQGEPVAWFWKNVNADGYEWMHVADNQEDADKYLPNKAVPLYTTPQQRIVFPTMLRKMWSGGEVQAWLDENVNKE
jgi:hypothetical protein